MLYVTGITGHSGRWFLKRLQEEGYNGKIRCVMRESKEDSPDKYKIFNGCTLDLEFAIGRLEDKDFLLESLKGVTTLIHIAGINLSTEIVDAAMRNNVKWVILVHTTGRFSKYKSASEGYIKIEDDILALRDELAAQQQASEIQPKGQSETQPQPIISRSMAVTILRPTMIYGSSRDKNMYRLVEYLSKYPVFPLFGDGSNMMQPVHAIDLGNAYYDVLIKPEITMNKEYDLSGKEPITYLDIIKTIKNILNSKVLIVSLPISLSIFAAKLYNKLFKNAVITVEQVMRMQEDKAFSHEAATRDFGYNPLSFQEGVREEVEEYLSGVRVDYKGTKY